jgi:hypothetical protein
MTKLTKVLETVKATNGCKIASLTYRAKGSGELARHSILLGASLENAYKSDLETVTAYKLKLETELQAITEMKASLENSLEKGIGNNDSYTQKDKWKTVAKNVRLSLDEQTIQLLGMVFDKKVIEKGVFKKVNSSAKTIAKKQIRKLLELKAPRTRAFSVAVENIERIAANGDTIEIE